MLFEDCAEEIFTIYHRASEYQSCEVSVNSTKSGYKATLKIYFKSWFKSHKMKLRIKFDEDGPTEVKLVSDSHINKTFKKTKANKALYVIEEAWEELEE